MILKEGEGGDKLGIFAKEFIQNSFLYRKLDDSEIFYDVHITDEMKEQSYIFTYSKD